LPCRHCALAVYKMPHRPASVELAEDPVNEEEGAESTSLSYDRARKKRGKDDREDFPASTAPSRTLKGSRHAVSSDDAAKVEGVEDASVNQALREEQIEAETQRELLQRRQSYMRGTDSLRAHVFGLISQSQSGEWVEAIVSPSLKLDFPNVSLFYKAATEASEAAKRSPSTQSPTGLTGLSLARLKTRAYIVLPGVDTSALAVSFWTSFSSTNVLQKRYKGNLVQLAEDTIDKDTKMGYYRESGDDGAFNDVVVICNRSVRTLSGFTLRPCPTHGTNTARLLAAPGNEEKMHEAHVLVMSLTEHSVAPQHLNAKRITRLYLQGVILVNLGSSVRLCFVQSIPYDISNQVHFKYPVLKVFTTLTFFTDFSRQKQRTS